MFENVSPLVALTGLFLTIFGAVWSLAWWLSGKFTEVRSLVYSTAEKTADSILSKLEYHEKHDDSRFSNIGNRLTSVQNDIWELRVNNASMSNTVKKRVQLEETIGST